MLGRGLHVLPLHEGVDVIHFTKHSTPYKMGVTRIYFNRDSDEDKWNLNVRFDLVDPHKTGNPLFVVGKIEHNGKFNLTTPIDNYAPGIKAMLGRIAVLAFKDITHQQEKENIISGSLRIGSGDENKEESRSNDKDEKISYSLIPRMRTYVRRQSDVMLRESVVPQVSIDPRRIGTHKMDLPGIREYRQALEEYQRILKTRNASTEEVKDALNQARERVRKPNPRKLELWPENVAQTTYKDPVTGEIVYGNTWVVEYHKPKLTPEQELEIVLWQRNYRALNTSTTALATLDQWRTLVQ
jgi:hypothetical protein